MTELKKILEREKINNLQKVIMLLNEVSESSEPIIDENKVNIMTMHKAKGLSSKIVIIPALEEEIYREDCNKDEERRLLYVSLTRAKKLLLLTYCEYRGGSQGFSGTGNKNGKRKLASVLQDIPLEIRNGDNIQFINPRSV